MAPRATAAFSSPRRAASGATSFSTGRWCYPPCRPPTRHSSAGTLSDVGTAASGLPQHGRNWRRLSLGDASLPPFRRSQLLGHVPDQLLDGVLDELQDLSTCGMTPPHIARMLRLLAEERAAAQAVADRVELVWSGTEVLTATSRDTAVVVQELFREARESVLIASYALDTGSKAEELFGILAGRMDAEPDLRVRLFVNIHRKQRGRHRRRRSPAGVRGHLPARLVAGQAASPRPSTTPGRWRSKARRARASMPSASSSTTTGRSSRPPTSRKLPTSGTSRRGPSSRTASSLGLSGRSSTLSWIMTRSNACRDSRGETE